MAKEILEMEARLRNFVSKETNKIVGDLKRVDSTAKQSFGSADKATKAFSSSVTTLASRFGPAAIALGVFTKATFMVTNAIRQMRVATEELEVELSKVKAILAPTGADFDALANKARELGRATVFTATQSAAAFVEMGKRGFEASEIIAASSGVLDLAAGTMTDMSLAASTTVATLNQFNLEAGESRRIVDVMGKAFNTSALDMFSFSEAMKMVGPIAGVTGAAVEEVSAALAVLADREIKGSLAGTGMRRVLLELADENSKVSKAIADTGIEANTLTDKLRVLSMMNLTLGETTDFFTVRAVAAATVLIQNVDAVKDLNVEYLKAEGTMERMAKEMLKNVRGATVLLEAAQKDLGIQIGLTFGEKKIKRIKEATFRTKQFTKFLKENHEAVERIARAWDFLVKAALGTVNFGLKMVTTTAIFLASPLDRLDVLFKSIFGGETVKEIEDVTKVLDHQIDVIGDLDKRLRLADKRETISRKKPPEIDPDAAKKAAKEREEAEKDLFNAGKRAIGEYRKFVLDNMKALWEEREGKEKSGTKVLNDFRQKQLEDAKEFWEARKSMQLDFLITTQGEEVVYHQQRLEQLLTAKEQELVTEEQYNILIEEEGRRHSQTKLDRAIADADRIMGAANMLGSGLIGLSKRTREYELADEKARIRAMNITEKQKEKLLKQAENRNRDAAKKEKAIALALAIANTALGVTKEFATKGWVGYITGALVAAAGAVEIATIAGQKFQQGGIVAGTDFAGDQNTVRANAGEMFLTREQQAQLFALAQGGGGTTNNASLAVNFNVAPGANLDTDAADRIVESVEGLGVVLEEANRSGTLDDFKEMLTTEGV